MTTEFFVLYYNLADLVEVGLRLELEAGDVIEQFPDGSVTVSLDVILNIEMESKILAYGCHVEVLSPRLLRHNISKALAVAAAQY